MIAEVYCVASLLCPVHAIQRSPPSEKGPSALEALCVGLAVGTLGGAGRLHDHRRHLNQLQRRLGILQSLAQVQNLSKIREEQNGQSTPRELKSKC